MRSARKRLQALRKCLSKDEEIKMAEQTDELPGTFHKAQFAMNHGFDDTPVFYNESDMPKEGIHYIIVKSSSDGKYLAGTPMLIDKKRKDDKKVTVFFMFRVGNSYGGSNDVRYFDSIYDLRKDLTDSIFAPDIGWARRQIDEYEHKIKELNKTYFGFEE